MSNHIKRIPLYVITGIVAVSLIVWSAALIKCEILTNKYYDDFEYAYQGNSMLGDMEYFKVLKCNGETAEVYYVSKGNISGNVLEFKNQDGVWVEISWEAIWSASGSASNVVWPYWWQFFITGI